MNSDVYYQYDSGGNSAVQFCTHEEQIRRDQEDQRKLIEELEKEGVPELDEISDEDDDSMVGQFSNENAGPTMTNGVNHTNGQKRNSGGMLTRNRYDESYTGKDAQAGRNMNGYHRKSIEGQHNGNGVLDDRDLMLSVREREIHELKNQLCEKLRECEAVESKLTLTTNEKDRAVQSLKRLENDLADFKDKFDHLSRKEETLLKDIAFQKMELQDKDKMLRLLQDGSQEDTRLAALERQIQAKDDKHRHEIDNLNGEYESLYRKHKQLQQDSIELEMKIKNLKDKNDELSTEKSEEVVRLLREKSVLEEQLQKRAVEVRSGAESPRSEWRNAEKRLRAELAQKDTLIHTLRVELLARNHDLEGDDSPQLSNLKSRLAELETKLQEKDEEIVNLTIRNSRALTHEETSQHRINQQLKKLEEEKEEVSFELSKLKTALQEQDDVIESLKVENETVKRTYLDQQDLFGTEKKNLQGKIDGLNESLVELQTNHSRFCQKELENKAREIELLKAESETKTHQLEALKSLIEITEKAKTLDHEDVNERMVLSEQQRAAEAEKFERETLKLKEEIRKLLDVNQQLVADLQGLKSLLESQALAARSEVVVGGRRDAGTSPTERCMVQSEVMALLQTVAHKHEAERIEYEDKIAELSAKLEAASSNGSQKAASGSSLPEKDPQPSHELLVQLWRKYEDLSKSHGELSARVRDTESELSRALDETDSLKDRLKKAQAEYLACFDKYNKLKVQAKHYRDYYEGANKKLKEDMELEKKKWDKERAKWTRAEEGWHAERVKQERSLSDVLAELQRIKQSQPPPITLDGIFKLYNEEAKRLEKL